MTSNRSPALSWCSISTYAIASSFSSTAIRLLVHDAARQQITNPRLLIRSPFTMNIRRDPTALARRDARRLLDRIIPFRGAGAAGAAGTDEPARLRTRDV